MHPTPAAMSHHGIRVTHPHGDDHSIYAQLLAPLVGSVVQLDHDTGDTGVVCHRAVVVTGVDVTGLSYVVYAGDDLDVIGWDAATGLLDQHPELHTITTTGWADVVAVHVW